MITEAHGWYHLPDHGRQMLRCLYQLLNQVRGRHREDLAVILAAQAHRSAKLLRTSPALATRFPRSSSSPAAPQTSSPPSSPP